MQKNILLTGASGFIGFHTALKLQKEGFNVYAPVRNESLQKNKVKELRSKGISIIEGNFYENKTLQKLFQHEYFAIIHLAAIRGEIKKQIKIYNKVNIEGTKKLLDFTKLNKVKRFLYCSTVGVIGTIPKQKSAGIESDIWPDNIYHKSKWEAEELVRQHHSENFKIIVLRPTITYGAGDDGFILKLVELIKSKKFINCSKAVSIHLLNVTSFAQLILNVIQKDSFDGRSYIVADERPIHLREIVNLVANKVNGSDYPKLLVMPSFIFKMIAYMFKIVGENGLKTSVQLISNDWTYNISSTEKQLNYKPSSTLLSLQPIIKDYINALPG